MKTNIIVVCGSTASGKTGLAIALAKAFGGEVVSADSMQIYRHMNIGTAKPTKEEMDGIVHHMIDVAEPWEAFSVADFTEQAHRCIADISGRGKIPIVAGGTGLYINSLINDVDFGEIETDEEYRRELAAFAGEQGAEALWDKLREIDPAAAAAIHPKNVKRVIRAVEFYHTTGKRISVHQEETRQNESRYRPLMLEIFWDRPALYERINRRVDLMIQEGLLREMNELVEMGCTREMQSMKGIGYQELFPYLDGAVSWEDTVALIKRNSRRYAKRQITWFKRDKRIHRLAPGELLLEQAASLAGEHLAVSGV